MFLWAGGLVAYDAKNFSRNPYKTTRTGGNLISRP